MSLRSVLTNIGILVFVMQASKKIPFEDPRVLLAVRAFYVVSNLFLAGLFLYVKFVVDRKKDKTVLKYVEPAAVGSAAPNKPITTTVQEYDLSQIRQQFSTQAFGLAIMAFMHLYLKYSNPLLLQSIMPIKSALESNLFKIHVLGKPAVGEMQRPWKASPGFLNPSKQRDAKPSKKSIQSAERATKND